MVSIEFFNFFSVRLELKNQINIAGFNEQFGEWGFIYYSR